MKQANKRFLATLLVAIMFTGLIPGGAFFPIAAQAATLSLSDIVTVVDGDGSEADYTIDYEIATGGNFQITSAYDNKTLLLQTSVSGSITVAANVTVTLILNGTNRHSSDSPLQVGTGSVVTLVLMDGSNNSFLCGGTSTNAYRQQAGIHVPQGATLIIQEGYKQGSPRGSNAGNLTSEGGYYSAGIGGGPNQNSGTIKIEGGTIVARSNSSDNGRNNAAGIGGGSGQTNVGGNSESITICGTANVTATSFGHGAGIGGGGSGLGTPMPGSASGAGDGGIITIYGNTTVNATSRGNGAGIGGGGIADATSVHPAGAGGTIKIFGLSDASPVIVAATGHNSGADIGPGVKGGSLGTLGSVTITSGNVYANNMMGVDVVNEQGEPLNMAKKSRQSADATISQVVYQGTGDEYTYFVRTDLSSNAYMWLPTNFADITIIGKAGSSELYKVFFSIDTDEDPYPISVSALPQLAPMWRLKDGEAATKLGNISPSDGDQIITLEYVTGLADVKIHTKLFGSDSDVLAPIIIPDRTIGEQFGYDSIAIPGYQLVDDTSGANAAAYTETITVDADPDENIITFLYKPATGNLKITCEDENNNTIHIEYLDIPVNTAPNISPPSIPNHTTTDLAEPVTRDASGNPKEITFSYTRDTAPLKLQAYSTLDGQPIKDGSDDPITHETTEQRVLEPYNYFGDIADLTTLVNAAHPGLYTPVSVPSPINYYIELTGNEVRVYYNPVPSNAVIVECYVGSLSGTLIFSYPIPAASGEAVTLDESQVPDLSGMGYTRNVLHPDNDLTATEDTSDKIILIYNDDRFETKIIIMPASLGTPITEKTASPNKKMLYPPYISGYAATQYQVTGKPLVNIGSNFDGYEAEETTEITFYYEKYLIEPKSGELTITVIDAVTGAPIAGAAVTATDSPVAVTFPQTDANGDTKITDANLGNYTIEVTASGYTKATRYVTLSPSHAVENITIALGKPPSTGGGTVRPAYLIIRCLDENNREIFMQDVNVVVGMQEVIHAPPLSGYVLAKDETARKTIRIAQGENEVIFRYVTAGKEEPPRPPVSDKVKSILETEVHIKYIQGYPDGTVRPDSSITRAEVASIFWQLLKDSGKNMAISGSFDDVDSNAWYAQAVNYLASIDVINGYEDGTFQPDRNITRAEFAALISRFDDLSSSAVQPFSDVPANHWASSYIISAYLKGWVSGYPNGTFMPNNSITRAEVVKAVNYVLGRGIKAQDVPSEYHDLYTDLPVSHWAFAEIIEASVAHDYERLPDGYEIHK